MCTRRRTDVGALRVRALVQSRTDVALGTANAGTHSASGCGRNVDRLPHATPHQALLEKDRQPCLLTFANQIAHPHSAIGARAPLAGGIVHQRALLANFPVVQMHGFRHALKDFTISRTCLTGKFDLLRALLSIVDAGIER